MGGRRSEILDTAASLIAQRGTRTSVDEVAAACGILPGSLYHHFESKEAILLALIRRYRDDLEALAQQALAELDAYPDRPVHERAIELGTAIASCAVTHRAAVLLTIHEPAPSATSDFVRMASRSSSAIVEAMHQVLESGRRAGALRPGIDLRLLSERLCQSMLHHAVGDSYLRRGAGRVPELRCRILLEGLASRSRTEASLDRSAALRVAREAVATWYDVAEDDHRVARLRAAARAEFGRRGYEAATVRQVAATAGLTPASVYRYFGSKEGLLDSVVRTYTEQRHAAWDSVLGSPSSVLEKLDALAWLNINLLDRFIDEFRIQLGLLRASPPSIRKLGSSTAQRRSVRQLLVAGLRSGELSFDRGTPDTRARCVYEAIWVPEQLVAAAGVGGAHRLVRQTVLRGALATG